MSTEQPTKQKPQGTRPATTGQRTSAPGGARPTGTSGARPPASNRPPVQASNRDAVRAARVEARRKARKGQQGPNPVLIGAGAVGLLLVIAIVVFALNNPGTPGVAGRPNAPEGTNTYPNLSRDHVEDLVAYPQTPPVGGQHSGVWLKCGIYDAPVKNEQAVHSLEHGAVWITYQPTLAADQLEKLRTLTRQSAFRLLSPYEGIPSPIVLSAWGNQLLVQDADDARIMQFIQRFENDPNGPEPGADCSTGAGTPLP